MDVKIIASQGFAIPANIPWAELDSRYFAFAAGLPLHLAELAVDRQVFTGKGLSTRLNSLEEVHPLVTCLPWLFAEAFPTLSEADVLDITEAGVLLFMGVLLYDAYEDGHLVDHPGILLLHQQLMLAALYTFHALFEVQSSFWVYIRRYYCEYSEALLLEKEHWGQLKAYPLERMYKLGSGKVALFKSVTTALALKAQKEEYITHLEKAIDLLAAAMQLGDDIKDWAEDYQRQNYTMPLTSAIPAAYWPIPDLSVDEVGWQFERSVILEKLVNQVIEWFQLASDVVGELNCPHWVAFVESCLVLTKNYQESLVIRKLLSVFDATRSIQTND